MLENLGKNKIIEAMVLATVLALPTSMVVNNQSETALAVGIGAVTWGIVKIKKLHK